MTNSIAALCCVYHDDIWLPFMYRGIYDAVDKIYFFVNQNPWFGPATDNESTLNAISALEDPANKKVIVRESWDGEVAQRNYTLAYAQAAGHTHGFIVDADEIYDTETLKKIFKFCVSRSDVGCWHIRWYTYWKSPAYRIDPIEPYDPPMLVQLGRGGFVETRNILADKHELVPPEIGMCHHMSYARPDELIRRKINSFGHALEILPDWFENVWQKWDYNKSLENLHPVSPTQYKRAIPQPIEIQPAVLRMLNGKLPT